jgi:PIN domain nuclease of toxin-antitoxin system
MAYLLDTHTFLWFVAGDKQLPNNVKLQIKDINEVCFLSVASLWEITIKHQLGKLKLNISLEELFDYADRNQIEILQISNERIVAATKGSLH